MYCVCVCVYENVSVFVQGELCFWFSRSCVWSGAGGLTEYSPYFIHQVLHEFILNLRASLKVWQRLGMEHATYVLMSHLSEHACDVYIFCLHSLRIKCYGNVLMRDRRDMVGGKG